MGMILVVENDEHLDKHEKLVLEACEWIAGCLCSLDAVEGAFKRMVKAEGLGWLVYRGGSHIAVHKESGDSRRIAIVKES